MYLVRYTWTHLVSSQPNGNRGRCVYQLLHKLHLLWSVNGNKTTPGLHAQKLINTQTQG